MFVTTLGVYGASPINSAVAIYKQRLTPTASHPLSWSSVSCLCFDAERWTECKMDLRTDLRTPFLKMMSSRCAQRSESHPAPRESAHCHPPYWLNHLPRSREETEGREGLLFSFLRLPQGSQSQSPWHLLFGACGVNLQEQRAGKHCMKGQKRNQANGSWRSGAFLTLWPVPCSMAASKRSCFLFPGEPDSELSTVSWAVGFGTTSELSRFLFPHL